MNEETALELAKRTKDCALRLRELQYSAQELTKAEIAELSLLLKGQAVKAELLALYILGE